MKHLFSSRSSLLLVKFLTIPLTLIRSDSCCLHFSPQYIYETNENRDKVILGKGTYGVVYAGRDLSNQVRIAIKEIPEKDRTYEKPTLTVFPSESSLSGKH